RLNWFGYSIYGNYYRINDYGLTTKTGGSRYPMMLKSANKGIDMGDSEEKLLAEEETIVKTSNCLAISTPGFDSINESTETTAEINARSNFNETAFFYPAFKTNEQGELLISFTVPEALTKWKLLGLAHTKDLKYSLFSKELVTQKELMINTNAPRFLRQGDKIFISAKITNLTNQNIEGQAELKIYDAVTMKEINNIISGSKTALPFKIFQNISSQVQWQLNIPDNISAVTLKITAQSGNFSDGEEITLPLLSNRMLVTESLPLHIKGKQSKTFVFDKLKNVSDSKTLTNFKLTLEFTSNPIWLAVQALPYIMESDYESADEIFNRYYANSIAFFIVNSNPKIKKVFDMWRNYTPSALLSNLEKNQELKALLLQETPWVMDAKDESERKQRVALLFDINKMSQDLSNSFNKLQKLQTSNGAWSWFPGMPDNRFITQYIVTGFGHLKQLKVLNSNSKTNLMLKEAINYLDNRLRDDYEWLKKNQPKEMDKQHISATEIQYLYARSYFIEEIEISSANKEAYDYYKKQAKEFRNNFNNYSQAMIALAMNRTGDKTTTAAIIKSLKEKSLQSEEMGTYWKDNDNGYYWYQLPVETQALLIELFEEAGKDKQFTDDMRVWLIKQKQTRNWQTPKATAEACYALLIRGSELLASDDLVDIKLGNTQINPYAQQQATPEAGTGYFKISFTGEEIKSSMADVTVSKKTEGAAWGSLYWQYFEQLDKITTHSSPISLEKKVFRELSGEEGRKIELVSDKTKLSVGDRLRVRIVIRTDREMEYVHLKDMRASGLEPVNVLSSYKYQGGLGYYEATKDASVSFFIESLAKGTYVFEYPLIVSQKGDFSNGITSIQCLYAPEFTSHSEGIRITVE
ncbi:MAG: hypothetical protein KA792_10330, partial [Bacteroidales bacterium]|nr:hypothetical protein [Bacteroidales bacterium]